MIRILSTILLACLAAMPVLAEMVVIPADRDATLIEDAEGDVANGSGPSFFSGHTNQAKFGIRRGIVRFDVASALPADALIDSASLRLYQSSGNAEPGTVSLHRVLSDWGEGASIATGGKGVSAEHGDATWLHTYFDYDYWVQQGGHSVPYASASLTVGGKEFYTWESTVHLVNNVRLWMHAPQQNYGWLVSGDEDTPGSVKSFYSRECVNAVVDDVRHLCKDSKQRPVLIVEYHLPGE